MLFLRITLLLIIVLGLLIYLLSRRIRVEFLRTGGEIVPQFRGSSEEYKAFCKHPPTPYAANMLRMRKRFSIALMVAALGFLIAIISVVIEQT